MQRSIHLGLLLSLFFALATLLNACQAQNPNHSRSKGNPENYQNYQQNYQGAAMTPNAHPAPSKSAGFATHVITDNYLNNLPMVAFRTPEDWRVASEPRWNRQEFNAPFTFSLKAYDAAGKVGLEMYPALSFFWLPQMPGAYQVGRNYAGQVCLQPMPVAAALSRFVIARVRGNRQNLRIIETRPEPTPTGLASGVAAEAVMIKIEYSENGEMFEEEFHALKVQETIPNQGPQGVIYQLNWNLPEIYSRRALKGQLAASLPLFEAIKRSAKTNPQWGQAYQQVLQQIQASFNQQQRQGYASIAAAGQMSRAISANNDAMLGAIGRQRQSSWSPSTSGSDRTERQFSDYIRGVNSYDDPYWGQSQHSSNYDYVWTDGTGGYRYSNDSSFNPNLNSNGNWQLMNRK